jgi:hypothetical protein
VWVGAANTFVSADTSVGVGPFVTTCTFTTPISDAAFDSIGLLVSST